MHLVAEFSALLRSNQHLGFKSANRFEPYLLFMIFLHFNFMQKFPFSTVQFSISLSLSLCTNRKDALLLSFRMSLFLILSILPYANYIIKQYTAKNLYLHIKVVKNLDSKNMRSTCTSKFVTIPYQKVSFFCF